MISFENTAKGSKVDRFNYTHAQTNKNCMKHITTIKTNRKKKKPVMVHLKRIFSTENLSIELNVSSQKKNIVKTYTT